MTDPRCLSSGRGAKGLEKEIAVFGVGCLRGDNGETECTQWP